MLRISKLTDYGIVLLARFAQEPAGTTLNAREMAESTALPLPVVSKMLKTLAGAELLKSQRGAKGGYRLLRDPAAVTVAELLEGALPCVSAREDGLAQIGIDVRIGEHIGKDVHYRHF